MRIVRIIITLAMLALTPLANASTQDAPAIKLPALNGEVELATLKGKVVYLDFWASWCKPCKQSFPWMMKIKKAYADQGLEVIAVNLDKDRALADKFLEGMDINFIVAFDPEGSTAEAYKLKGMPSSYLIGRDGQLYASHIGFREKDKAAMEQALQELLAKQ